MMFKRSKQAGSSVLLRDTDRVKNSPIRCRTIIASLLMLPLLSGCLATEYLTASAPSQPPALQEMASLRDAGFHYTSHARAAAGPQIFSLIVTDTFSLPERAKVLRALNEWNVALNGFVRFEIMPEGNSWSTAAHETWVITSKQAPRSPGLSNALAATYSAPGVGGVVDIFVQRIGQRDLGGVVMHELGHVLGLGHNAKGGLMAAHYHPTSQRCIDKASVEAVAAKRGLPLAELNWCERE